MRRKRSLTHLEPDPTIPTLAWLIAKRVTDQMITLDTSVLVVGKKGSGKSIFCLGLSYEVAKAIAVIKHRKELKKLPEAERMNKIREYAAHYFNMDHVRSVDKEGTLELFSGDVLMTENSVLLLDDVSIAANSRNSQTKQNKSISQIQTISRPYRNTLIMNTVFSSLIDKTARQFADIVIELLGIDKKRKRSIAKVYLYTVNQATGKEYRKYFKFGGKRVVYWASELPPKHLIKAYEKLRMEKTKELIENFHEEQIDRNRDTSKQKERHEEIIKTWTPAVLEGYAKGDSIRSLTRLSPDLTEYWVNKIIGNSKASPVVVK
jgi:hypothetical protein